MFGTTCKASCCLQSDFVILAGVLWVSALLLLAMLIFPLNPEFLISMGDSSNQARHKQATPDQRVPHFLPISTDHCLLAQTAIQAAQTLHP
jgi:hypothetical protein